MPGRSLRARGSAFAAAACVSLSAVAGCQGASEGAGRWGTAIEVPGTAALNKGDSAQVTSVSCASAGNCSAGGFYHNGSGYARAFVVGEVNGTWGTAIEVPGTAALDQGGWAQVTSVSCASPGNCAAGGAYRSDSHPPQAFVASEVNGTWRTAIEVPGTASLNKVNTRNTDGGAGIASVSCASPGNCSAAGFYTIPSGDTRPFVVNEVNRTWGTAIEVPGVAALSTGGSASIASLSCASSGNCSAGGSYRGPLASPTGARLQAFVVSQVHGTWQPAAQVTGTAALNNAGTAAVTSVSCGSPGNCVAGGYYAADRRAFLVREDHGTWDTATAVPGLPAIRGFAAISSVSCPSARNCTAAGTDVGAGSGRPFVVSAEKGTWGMARRLRVPAAFKRAGFTIVSVSCASAGNCTAGGYYNYHLPNGAFVVAEKNGTWGTASAIPGLAALNKAGQAQITSVSCAPAAGCTAAGYYSDRTSGDRRPNGTQAFVVSQH